MKTSTPFLLACLLALPARSGRAQDSPPQAASGMAEVPQPAIFYETAGQGPPLVLIHGGLMDRRMWDDQFAVFARHFRVVRYDFKKNATKTVLRRRWGISTVFSPFWNELTRWIGSTAIKIGAQASAGPKRPFPGSAASAMSRSILQAE